MSSLTETRSGSQPGNDAKRYSYDSAGQLVKVEAHDGTTYQPQAEMIYNGLSQRIAVSAYASGQRLTSTYILDGQTLMSATADGETTYYLPGIGEEKQDWTYYLADGLNNTRLLTEEEGLVILTRSYTPWGEVLEQAGSGELAFGYLGGVLDAATGLIYVGNGQYYDPATGRFLSRGTNSGAPNPYVPWQGDPLGVIMGPLALLVLSRGKRKGGKVDQFLAILIIALAVSLTVSGCTPGGDGRTPTQPPSTPPSTPTEPQPTHPGGGSPTPTQPPTRTPIPPPTCTPTPNPTQTPAPRPEPTRPAGLQLKDERVWTTYIKLWNETQDKKGEVRWWWRGVGDFTVADYVDRLLEFELDGAKGFGDRLLQELAVGNLCFWNDPAHFTDTRWPYSGPCHRPSDKEFLEYVDRRKVLVSEGDGKDYSIQEEKDFDKWQKKSEIPFKEGFASPDERWLDWRNTKNWTVGGVANDPLIEWGNDIGGFNKDFYDNVKTKSKGIGRKTNQVGQNMGSWYAFTFCQYLYYQVPGEYDNVNHDAYCHMVSSHW